MLVGHVLREACPVCARSGCPACRYSGYVFRELYDQRTSGEMRLDIEESEPAFVVHDEQASARHQ